MTILNVWLKHDSALIGADSEAVAPDGTVSCVSKIFPLVAMNAVIATRGTMLFTVNVWGYCYLSGGNFDGLVDKMPAILRAAFDQTVVQCAQLGTAVTEHDGQTVLLSGWSEKAARMMCLEWSQDDPAIGFKAESIQVHHIAPGVPDLQRRAPVDTPALMAALADEQTRILWRDAPSAAAGGKFIVCHLSREAMRIETACTLPMRTAR